eukprot:305846_1
MRKQRKMCREQREKSIASRFNSFNTTFANNYIPRLLLNSLLQTIKQNIKGIIPDEIVWLCCLYVSSELTSSCLDHLIPSVTKLSYEKQQPQ